MKYSSIFEQPGDSEQPIETPDILDLSSRGKNQSKKQSAEKPEDKKQDNKKAERKEQQKKEEKASDKKKTGSPKSSPDTPEKTREEKRAELVERSRRLKDLYEDEDAPKDPVLLARLLVAKNILALHQQIEHPELREEEIDEHQLLETLDYMGELAEKLEHPEIEAPPEIEDACHTLTSIADQSIREAVPIEELITPSKESEPSLPSNSEEPASEPQIQRKLNPTAALFALLLIARKKSKSSGGASADPIAPPTAAPINPDPPTLAQKTPAVASGDKSSTMPIAPQEVRKEYLKTIHSERQANHRPPSPERFAASVLATASRRELPAKPSTQTHTTASIPHTTYDQLRSTVHHAAAPAATHHETIRQAAKPEEHHENTLGKLEHMPLISLLSMAETIPIGHGRRLRSAYEKGMIDQEGLIKILKSRAKGKDFLQEYKQQAARQRNLVQTSPEFLRSTTSSTHDEHEDSSATLAEKAPNTAPENDSVVPKPNSLATSTHDLLESMKKQAEIKQPAVWPRLLIIAGILVVIVVIVLFSFL